MTHNHFIATIVISALTSIGGITVSSINWHNASTADKHRFIDESKLHNEQKKILRTLISTESFADLEIELVYLYRDLSGKAQFVRNTEAKNAFENAAKEVEEFLRLTRKLNDIIDKISETRDVLKNLLSDDAEINNNYLNTNSEHEAFFEEAINKSIWVELNKLKQNENELIIRRDSLVDLARQKFIHLLIGTEEAYVIWESEKRGNDKNIFGGLVVACFGILVSSGTSVKLYYEIKKLKLETSKLLAT